ncbi:MAG: thioredoxin [Candidatus Eremiobacterota bacterium]
MGNVAKVSDATFQSEVLDSDIPVLVDFFADWCGPCKMLEPVVEKVAEQYQGKVKFVKLNTDDNPQTQRTYGIRGLPTMIMFHKGQPVDKRAGYVPDSELTRFVEKALSQAAT